MPASPAITQDQLDRLFTAALEAAIGRIEKDGHFHPFVFELRENGTIQAIAVLETGEIDNSREPVQRLSALLRPRAEQGLIAAAAIAVLDTAGSEVEVRMRAANYSSDIQVPFTAETKGFVRRKRRVILGNAAARNVVNDVFGGAA